MRSSHRSHRSSMSHRSHSSMSHRSHSSMHHRSGIGHNSLHTHRSGIGRSSLSHRNGIGHRSSLRHKTGLSSRNTPFRHHGISNAHAYSVGRATGININGSTMGAHGAALHRMKTARDRMRKGTSIRHHSIRTSMRSPKAQAKRRYRSRVNSFATSYTFRKPRRSSFRNRKYTYHRKNGPTVTAVNQDQVTGIYKTDQWMILMAIIVVAVILITFVTFTGTAMRMISILK